MRKALITVLSVLLLSQFSFVAFAQVTSGAFPDVPDDRHLGPLGLYLGVWGRYSRTAAEMVGQHGTLVHERSASGLGRRPLGYSCPPHAVDQPSDTHAVPGDVHCHHTGADLRRVRRADEVQHDGGVHDPLGDVGLLPPVPLGLGRRNSAIRQRKRRTLRRRGTGLRRRHRCAYQFRRNRVDLRVGAWKTLRLRQ